MSSGSHSSRTVVAYATLGIVAGALAYGCLRLVSSPFFVAGGSDALLTNLEPPGWAQFVACVIVAAAIGMLPFIRLSVATIFLAVALFAFLSAGHRVTIDGRQAEVRDAYLSVPISRTDFDPVEGLAADFQYDADGWFLTLKRRDGRQPFHVFLGVPPWRIDPTPLMSFWPDVTGSG